MTPTCTQDGVIDATIDHVNKTMVSKANLDVYSTAEPQVGLRCVARP